MMLRKEIERLVSDIAGKPIAIIHLPKAFEEDETYQFSGKEPKFSLPRPTTSHPPIFGGSVYRYKEKFSLCTGASPTAYDRMLFAIKRELKINNSEYKDRNGIVLKFYWRKVPTVTIHKDTDEGEISASFIASFAPLNAEADNAFMKEYYPEWQEYYKSCEYKL